MYWLVYPFDAWFPSRFSVLGVSTLPDEEQAVKIPPLCRLPFRFCLLFPLPDRNFWIRSSYILSSGYHRWWPEPYLGVMAYVRVLKCFSACSFRFRSYRKVFVPSEGERWGSNSIFPHTANSLSQNCLWWCCQLSSVSLLALLWRIRSL